MNFEFFENFVNIDFFLHVKSAEQAMLAKFCVFRKAEISDVFKRGVRHLTLYNIQ